MMGIRHKKLEERLNETVAIETVAIFASAFEKTSAPFKDFSEAMIELAQQLEEIAGDYNAEDTP